MIEIKVKIHDKFSVEFKVGFVVGNGNERDNNFAINTWLFIPNSLDINPATYDKEDFYRDAKSNVRLITPVFLLRDIVNGKAIPLHRLRTALENLATDPTREHIVDYEYHIKMFSAIVKSALRDETYLIEGSTKMEDIRFLCLSFVENAHDITTAYRGMRQLINTPTITPELRTLYGFGDEFISHLISNYSFRIINCIDKRNDEGKLDDIREQMACIIQKESQYKRDNGYVATSSDDPQSNRNLVYRHNILKKYVSSDLYIRLNKKRDGQTVREIYYSIAAGIAMVFATVIAFAFQRRFGNFSGPLFVALVVSYMLKDRIKDLARYYFAHRLGRKYFDNKAVINIKEQPVGWLKEGMDFITDDKVPAEVLEIRGRSPLLEAENRIFDEKIILYRKLVYINEQELSKYNDYKLSGINDILRIYINRFSLKMDDPQVPLKALREDGSIETIYTDKIYYINFVMQFQYDNNVEYKRFRLVVTRSGILDIEEMH